MGDLLHTDTVASVSGTNNEVLTLTTGGLTANEYQYYIVRYVDRNIIYVISSHTDSTITIDTSSSIFDLSGKTIQIRKPSDYFGVDEDGNFPDINSSLNINQTDDMTEEISSTDLSRILPKIEKKIHDVIKRDSPLSFDDVGYGIVQNTVLSMLMRWNRRRQYNKMTTQIEITQMAYIPELTNTERRDLMAIVTGDGDESMVFDQQDSYGHRIYPNEFRGDW